MRAFGTGGELLLIDGALVASGGIRHREERSDEAIQKGSPLSDGLLRHSPPGRTGVFRRPFARNDDRGSATSYCRKSEIALSCPDEHLYAFAAQNRRFARPRRDLRGKSASKNFPMKIRRNPLIRLDSDEEIQGNPRPKNKEFAPKRPFAKEIQIYRARSQPPASFSRQ
jgi:hypothetical protein